jgi:hypothetical protein
VLAVVQAYGAVALQADSLAQALQGVAVEVADAREALHRIPDRAGDDVR